MGIGGNDLRLLIELKKQGCIPNQCYVAEIGAQQLAGRFLDAQTEVEAIGRLFGANLPCQLPESPKDSSDNTIGLRPLDPKAPSAREFWSWLGLNYTAIDIDGTPSSLPLDLNYDEVPM